MAATQASSIESDDELKKTLQACLDAFIADGSFAAKGLVHEADPGLEVDGLGRFGMPLSEPEVQRLISASRQAPFGKGSETVVDTTVRKTWEIDGSRIRLCHPKWPDHQKAILEQACKQLGIASDADYVQAQLYKLLVYEPGAMFKPHKDTEKTPRMFGTLVVCPPCDHTGGELILSFNGQREVFMRSLESQWSCPYFSWFADVLHEV